MSIIKNKLKDQGRRQDFGSLGEHSTKNYSTNSFKIILKNLY